jgi:branched-chain amino acid transport system ATP-binding protein
MTMLVINNLVKRFGGLTATDNLSLSVQAGELLAIIGPNGAGKTTLIHQLSGEFFPDSGQVLFDGRDITREPPYRRALAGLGRSYQITSVFLEFTALENVMFAVQAHAGHSFRFWQSVKSQPALVEPARAALAEVGLAEHANKPAGSLAHGQRRQLEIAMTLATSPKLLLLDEPMAGMSQHESEGVIALLSRLKKQYTILLIEHDMDAVFALADRITMLVYGRAIVTGTVDEIRGNAQVREAYLGVEETSA